MRYILAIDQGTTGSKALVVDENLTVVAESYQEFPQHFPKPGWVEHDLNEIWSSVLKSLSTVLKKVDGSKIEAIGITNQRETVCFWDRKAAEPIARAIVWQDRRTSEQCEQLKAKGIEPFIQERSGLLLDPYFSGTKVAWALKNWPEVKQAHDQGRLAVGTIDSFLIAKLSGGSAHVTEPSNASRTLCYHLTQHQWDNELASALGVPNSIWPEVRPSMGDFARVHGMEGLKNGTPITGVLGDQQAALLGQACIKEGAAKCTYGTGAFILLNTGSKPARSRHRLVSTIAWSKSAQDFTYALEGSAFVAGSAVQWVRDGLKIIKKSSEIETLATSVPSSDGVTFVPSLTGLGAPYWNPNATGMLTGITRGTERGHIARAVLEGIAFQNADILTAMQKDLGRSLSHLNVDGGMVVNELLMKFQADILGVKLVRPKFKETTVLGAVFAAGIGAGIWSDFSAIEKTWKEDKTFEPQMDPKLREQELKRWQQAIARVNL